jgi:hypothetical protein
MKKLIVLFFILLPFTSFSQNPKALDDKYGFREMKFETLFNSIKNLVKVEEGFYKSTTEDLKLGDYQLNEVVYSFYKDQLYIILIKVKGVINSNGVLKILQQAYGSGYQSNRYIESYLWNGQKTIMSYEQNSITGDATIFMWCKKLSDLKDADEKKANSEAAKKL